MRVFFIDTIIVFNVISSIVIFFTTWCLGLNYNLIVSLPGVSILNYIENIST